MVVIRLSRAGAKKEPFYQVVVADRRASRDGRFIENVGYFNPVARGQSLRLQLQKEKIEGWIAKGALPSERVQSLLKECVEFQKHVITAEDATRSKRVKRKDCLKNRKADKIKQEAEATKAAEVSAADSSENKASDAAA